MNATQLPKAAPPHPYPIQFFWSCAIFHIHNNGQFWRIKGRKNTVGEFFNPGYDCSNILDNIPDATDGFYWINIRRQIPRKVRVFNVLSLKSEYHASENGCLL
jgi:hypothetical protein